jgi:dipeptidase
MKRLWIVCILLACLLVSAGAADCTTVGAVGAATRDGVTILAKNRDYPADTGQILFFEPDRQYPAGEKVGMQTLTIDQAAETWQLMGFKALDDRGKGQKLWRWGLGMGMNRFGVCVANDDATTWDKAEGDALHDNDITRLILERCRTAREAVDLVDRLIAEHGSLIAEIYTVADAREVWIIETTGRHWAAVRITDGVFTRANRFEITEPDLPDDSGHFRLGRKELVEFCRANGHYHEEDGHFSFRLSYDPDYLGKVNLHYNETRYRRALALLEPLRGQATMETIAAILRDHYEGWLFKAPDGRELRLDAHGTGPHAALGGPFFAEKPTRTICYGSTVGSMIAVVDPKSPPELGGTLWASLYVPCLGVFVPYFPAAPMRLEPGLTRASDRYEPDSLWWQFAVVERNLEPRWAESAAVIHKIRDFWRDFEKGERRKLEKVRSRADKLQREGRGDQARKLLADFSADCQHRMDKAIRKVQGWIPNLDRQASSPPPFVQQK